MNIETVLYDHFGIKLFAHSLTWIKLDERFKNLRLTKALSEMVGNSEMKFSDKSRNSRFSAPVM